MCRGATTLHGMLDIPEKIVKYVNDYKILLVEARRNDLMLHNMNNVDLFNLLEIILDKKIPKNEAKKKAIQYGEEHQVDKSVVMTVAGATNSKIDYNAFEKGEMSMCTLFDEIAKERHEAGQKKLLKQDMNLTFQKVIFWQGCRENWISLYSRRRNI